MKQTAIIAALVISMGVLATLYYARTMPLTCLEECAVYHHDLIAGTADSPHQYRVLGPFMVEALFAPKTPVATAIAYISAHLVVLPITLLLLYRWFRDWLTPVTALLGILVITAYSPIMFGVYGISINTPLEACFLCMGLLWLRSGRSGVAYGALIVVAALNRETAILLVLAFVALRWRERHVWRWTAVYGVLWAAVFIGLRVWRGPAPDQITVAQVFAANFGGGWNTTEAILNNAFLVPVWILAAMGYKTAPQPLKRLALVGVPYLGMLAVFALWNETRLLMPLFVLWMPLALRALEKQIIAAGTRSAASGL